MKTATQILDECTHVVMVEPSGLFASEAGPCRACADLAIQAAVEAEREECAQVADEDARAWDLGEDNGARVDACEQVAAAIRNPDRARAKKAEAGT